MFIAELLEAGMLICFGLSWPMNAYKSYKAKTALGTSWQFLALICAGYACGVAAKLTLGSACVNCKTRRIETNRPLLHKANLTLLF